MKVCKSKPWGVGSTSRLKFWGNTRVWVQVTTYLKPFGGVVLVGFDILSAMAAKSARLQFIELGEL